MTSRQAFIRPSSRLRQFNYCKMLPTLDVYRCLLVTNLPTLFCMYNFELIDFTFVVVKTYISKSKVMCTVRFWNNLGKLKTRVIESQITQKSLGARNISNVEFALSGDELMDKTWEKKLYWIVIVDVLHDLPKS